LAFTGRKYDYTPKNAMEERYTSSPPETQERMRNDLTISALEGLCLFMGALRDGRKTILYVSEGLSSALPAGVATKGTLFPRPQAAAPTENTQMQDSQAFFQLDAAAGRYAPRVSSGRTRKRVDLHARSARVATSGVPDRRQRREWQRPQDSETNRWTCCAPSPARPTAAPSSTGTTRCPS
jgi:hypothetical protein